MKNDFTLAFNEIMDLRALSREVVLEAIEQALVSAYKRDAQISTKQRIEAEIDAQGQPHIYVEKEVAPSVVSEQTEVTLEVAQERYGAEVQMGDMVMMPVTNTSADFGRIAAQTAKQVILQRIREAERETLYGEYIERQGDLITGTVQSISGKVVTLSLGRAEAIMPKQHQIPGEKYRQHEKIRTYVVEVTKSSRGPQIIVSRAHKDMLRRLLEYEVPEIYNGQVEIKNIAREAGQRSKVAVAAIQDGIDPVGACVGMKGMRIQNIIKELMNEKIDVIEWDPDPKKYIAKSLSPARVSGVYLDDDLDHVRTATVIVLDDQLSLAIGKEGQNARLAAKLTGWRIDIKSVTESANDNFNNLDRRPLSVLHEQQADFITEVTRIIEKKRANRPVMPEEFSTLIRFVDMCENLKLQSKESGRQVRRAKFDAVRNLVPSKAFEMPLAELELADDIVKALGRIDNVGDLMVRVLSDEENLEMMLHANGAGADAMEAIRYALDDLVILEDEIAEPEPEVVTPETVAVADEIPQAEGVAEAVVEGVPAEAVPAKVEEDDGLTPEMWPDEAAHDRSRRKKGTAAKAATDVWEEDDELRPGKKAGKKQPAAAAKKRPGKAGHEERRRKSGGKHWSEYGDDEY